MFSLKRLVPALAALLLVTVLPADDLSGTDTFVCTISQVTICEMDKECVTGSAWKENVPLFILVDLDKEMLSTTEASGENRVSPIEHHERENGLIILQGTELGRAFSFTVVEETGFLTGAVALPGEGVVGFGACTPTPVK